MFLTHANPPVVCIDPGHPSEVGRGTSGRHITEIQAAWQVAKYLKADLEAAGVRTVLTKSKEQQMVTNKHRAEVANGVHANLMVRLHCDASSGTGFTTYYPDQQGTANGFRGPSFSLLRTIKPIAVQFHRVLAGKLKGILVDNGLKGDEYTAVGRKLGALNGSIYSKVPVVLVEMVVLTNRKDEALIGSPQGQKKVADALASATLAVLNSEKS